MSSLVAWVLSRDHDSKVIVVLWVMGHFASLAVYDGTVTVGASKNSGKRQVEEEEVGWSVVQEYLRQIFGRIYIAGTSESAPIAQGRFESRHSL